MRPHPVQSEGVTPSPPMVRDPPGRSHLASDYSSLSRRRLSSLQSKLTVGAELRML